MELLEKYPEKRYFTIGEVAAAFDVNVSLLRYWDKEFDLINPKKNAKGNRLFSREDIKNIGLVYQLVKVRGYTLEGARQKLAKNKNETLNTAEVTEKLMTLRAELEKIKNHL